MPKLIRITTVPLALHKLLHGQMKFISNSGFEVLMVSADGPELKQVIADEECRHKIIHLTRAITPFRDLVSLFKMIKLFLQEKPDIVHTHTPKAGLIGMLAAKLCNVKVRIHTVAGLPLMAQKGLKKKILIAVEKLTYACANQVWPNSFSLENYIRKNIYNKKKLRVLGSGSTNGIDLVKFDRNNLQPETIERVKEKVNFNAKNIYFLFVGRIVSDKGIVELVEAFKNLQKNYSNIKLILVGSYEDDLDPIPTETKNEINANNDIIHVGWSNEVEYYMAISNCFVFPSHREGFPNVLLQAGCLQLPIICSNIEGNIDIISDNNTGSLFEKKSAVHLYKKLSEFMNNKEKYVSYSQNLYQNITLKYKRENVWNNILNEYKLLLNA